jgi:CRP/FNR family transcriptional regulator, dissimilatory nitrate respiration regulator
MRRWRGLGRLKAMESMIEGRSSESPTVPVLPRVPRRTTSPAAEARLWEALLGAPAPSSEDVSALALLTRLRTVPQGGVVFASGEPAATLVFVREGDAALGSVGADGRFQIERTVRGPGWLDQSAAWFEATHAVDARATTPLVVGEVAREDIAELLQDRPALAACLLASLAREVHMLTRGTQELMHKDAPARFAAWLVQRFQAAGDDDSRGFVRLTERKRDIASQLAITPETLSRVMRSLTRQGLIAVSGYTVEVVDVEGLRRAALPD